MIYSSRKVYTDTPPIQCYSFQSIIEKQEINPETELVETKTERALEQITYFGKFNDLEYWGVPDSITLSMSSQPEQAEVTAIPEPDAELLEWLTSQSGYAKYLQLCNYSDSIQANSRTEQEEKATLYQQINDIASVLVQILEQTPLNIAEQNENFNSALSTVKKLKAQSDSMNQKFKDVGL